jgi:hypothetical protein
MAKNHWMGIASVILSFASTSGTVAAALGAAMYHRGTMVYASVELNCTFLDAPPGYPAHWFRVRSA